METNEIKQKNHCEENKIINNRDTEFIDTLIDGEYMKFYLENKDFYGFDYKYEKNDPNRENDFYLMDDVTNKLYFQEIRYPEYFEYLKTIEKDFNQVDVLYNANKIIYPCSYINIQFNYPNYNTVTFKVFATDKSKGFTTKELADKIIRYYHMLYMINYNYNYEKGVYTNKNPSYIFNYKPDYDIYNGIRGLKYSKKINVWKVQMSSYESFI